MKKLILILSILCLLSSCDDKEKELHDSKIKQLEKELIENQKQIDSLKKNNLKTVEKFIDFSKKHNEGFVSKEYVSFFLKDDLKFATNKKKVIQFFFDHFKLNEWDIDRGVVNSYLIESHSENKETAYEDITSKESLCAYIISRIDRSPKSLERIFSPTTKNFIYSLLKKDDLYKKAGVYTIVKALLYSYQEINNDDLSRIYEIASNEDYDETLNYISNLPSKKAKNLLKNTEDYTAYETWSDEKSRTFLVYTFWARRYNEGNKKFVYTFLTELHKALTEEEIEL